MRAWLEQLGLRPELQDRLFATLLIIHGDATWEEILDAFAAAPDVDSAYITRRGFSHVVEEKPAMRAAMPGPGGALPPPA